MTLLSDGVNVIWAPQEGSQELFLLCPYFEVLYGGTRGPGKTDALIMDFAQHVGQGFGPHWRGILFRRTYKQLDDVVKKTREIYRLEDTQVHLDSLADIGTFLKFETKVIDDSSEIEEARELLDGYCKKLGIEKRNLQAFSYSDLLIKQNIS